jgi:hypothetical protein
MLHTNKASTMLTYAIHCLLFLFSLKSFLVPTSPHFIRLAHTETRHFQACMIHIKKGVVSKIPRVHVVLISTLPKR